MIVLYCSQNAGLVDESFTMYLLALISRNEALTSKRIFRVFDEEKPNVIRYAFEDHNDIALNVAKIQQWINTSYFAKYIVNAEALYGEAA